MFLGVFHVGVFRALGVYPLLGRLANANGDPIAFGMTPAIHGDKPWACEYSMLPDLSGKVTAKFEKFQQCAYRKVMRKFRYREEKGTTLLARYWWVTKNYDV